jgi:hypothetical protein
MTEFQASLDEQLAERMDELNIRLQMAADFANNLQSLQN